MLGALSAIGLDAFQYDQCRDVGDHNSDWQVSSHLDRVLRSSRYLIHLKHLLSGHVYICIAIAARSRA